MRKQITKDDVINNQDSLWAIDVCEGFAQAMFRLVCDESVYVTWNTESESLDENTLIIHN